MISQYFNSMLLRYRPAGVSRADAALVVIPVSLAPCQHARCLNAAEAEVAALLVDLCRTLALSPKATCVVQSLVHCLFAQFLRANCLLVAAACQCDP